MSLADITQKILDDAKIKADSIRIDAEKKAEQILSLAKESATKSVESLNTKGKKKAEQMHKKIENLVQHQEKTGMLEMKRRKLRDVFFSAKKKIQTMPSQEKERVLLRMFSQIDAKEGTIFPTIGDEKIVESSMKKSGKSFHIGKGVEGMGGFCLVTPSLEMDFRFDAIVDRELSQKMEGEISHMLFS